MSGKDLILHIIGMIGVDGALYRSMEFTGDGVASLTIDDRFTVCNMAIEAGAKNGVFPVDATAKAYLAGHCERPPVVYEADADAQYEKTYEIDLGSIRPTVSFPHLPDNTRTIDEVGKVKIDQVVIGSCTNGRISDLRVAASVLKGHQVGLRCPHPSLPRHAGNLSPSDGGGPVADIRGVWSCGEHAHVRTLSGRPHGHSGKRRAGGFHDESELCRPYGPCGERSVSGKSGCRGGFRSDRLYHQSETLEEMR